MSKVEPTSQWFLSFQQLSQWSKLVELTSGMTCAWADYDGFHIDACPVEQPISTHLWGWRSDLLLRLRISDSRLRVALLSPGAREQAQQVPVREAALVGWATTDLRVMSDVTAKVLDQNVDLVEVLLPSPIAFYRIG